MKPMLKAPGSKRLKLTFDEQLSSFAFKLNLHRYTMARRAKADNQRSRDRLTPAEVGPCRLNP